MMKAKTFVSFFCISITILFGHRMFSQDKIEIEYDTSHCYSKQMEPRDSVVLCIECSFKHSAIEIGINSIKYMSDTITTIPTLGVANFVTLPKIDGYEKVGIRFGPTGFYEFLLDKKYCFIHINYNYDKKKLYLMYTNCEPVYE